mmetsp:Transcript_3417/g.2396  ORF Transcript_3417/g.2396 Transcript_3417/m.2396 type:complete len:109 (+) Transcript_3417:143-469(+)
MIPANENVPVTTELQYTGYLDEEGKRWGKGKVVWPDGSVYEGDWKYDLRHGFGEYKRPTGYYYKGFWKKHVMHGTGEEVDDLGAKSACRWFGGKRSGPGTYEEDGKPE